MDSGISISLSFYLFFLYYCFFCIHILSRYLLPKRCLNIFPDLCWDWKKNVTDVFVGDTNHKMKNIYFNSYQTLIISRCYHIQTKVLQIFCTFSWATFIFSSQNLVSVKMLIIMEDFAFLTCFQDIDVIEINHNYTFTTMYVGGRQKCIFLNSI